MRWTSNAQTADYSRPKSVRAEITTFAVPLASGLRGDVDVVVVVVVVMGDSRRHKDISHAAQRGLVEGCCCPCQTQV